MAKVRIYQKPAGIPVNTSVFAVEILQNNIWYTRKVSWETLKGLIAGAESLVFNNGTLTFTTPDGVAHQVLSVDSEVTPNSANPVSSGAVSTALASKQDALTFDQVPTDGSTNPVESNGIYDALAGKQDTLTFDTTPTDGSTNPVTSAGIYAAISAITTGIDWKEAVATYADIATTYPNPQDGWTVTTLDDDHTYRYTGTEWVDMFSLITQATAEKDGLMSAADFTKLAGIEAQANKTVVSDTLTPSTTTKKLATVSGGGSSTDILGDDADAILRAAFGEHTASGNPVSVDAFLGLEVVSECKVTMNPIQDLHGQSSPYPAGGGKNKLPLTVANLKSLNTSGTWSGNAYTLNNVVFTVLTDESGNVIGINANGTASADTSLILNEISPNDGGIINGCTNGSSTTYRLRIYYFATSGVAVQHTQYADNGDFTLHEATASWERFRLDIVVPSGSAVTNVKFYPMLRLATVTDGTFAPYENICPISGRTEASVKRTGKNQLNPVFARNNCYYGSNGSLLGNNSWSICLVPVERLSTITISGITHPDTGTFFVWLNSSTTTDVLSVIGNHKNYTNLTVPSGAKYLGMSFLNNSQSANYDLNTAQVEIGETATAYEPYQVETHTHTYESTVYGGNYDFVSGEGESKYGEYTLLGTENWSIAGSGTSIRASISVADKKIAGVGICNCFKYGNAENVGEFDCASIFIRFNISGIATTSAEFNTWISQQTEPIKVVYELATPTPITNTPEDISLLKGVNVLSTDGDSLELKYSADIKAYIDSKLNA